MNIETIETIAFFMLIIGSIYIISFIYFELKKPSKYEEKYKKLQDFNDFVICMMCNNNKCSENKIILSYLKNKNKEEQILKNEIDVNKFKKDVLDDLDLI